MPSDCLDASVNEIQWVKLELDLGGFNPGPFLAPLPAGVRVMTLPELGDGQRRRPEIYELNKECAADIPERGDFFSWAEYQRVRFDDPRFRPDGQLLAVTGDELVGLCQVSQRPGVVWARGDDRSTAGLAYPRRRDRPQACSDQGRMDLGGHAPAHRAPPEQQRHHHYQPETGVPRRRLQPPARVTIRLCGNECEARVWRASSPRFPS